MKKQIEKNSKYFKEVFTGISLVAHLGSTMVICIVGLFFLGLFIDNKFNTGGIAIIIGIILGVVTGAVGCYRIIKGGEEDESEH